MTCSGSGARGEELHDVSWRNWAGTRTLTVPVVFRPSNLTELVAVVTRAEAENRRVKAVGSSMSYTEAAVAPDVGIVVETHLLSRVVENIIPAALSVRGLAIAGRLVHVEAGIKIHALNCLLDQRHLAMPTLGGAYGQSLVGAISTGTHGCDIDRPPIADNVRAMHLVGPGGKEWWIERSGARSITDPASMERLRAAGTLCADAAVVYDDRTFNAVLVSAGRMGILYSVVIEAVDAYRLRETREPRPWSGVAALLRTAGLEPPVTQVASSGGTTPRSRAVEIVINPFFNGAGDRDCVITRRWETTEPVHPRDSSDSFFTILCRQQDIGAILGPMIPLVNAAMLAAFGILLAIPFVGPFLFGLATAGYVSLMTAMTAIVAGSTGGANLAEALARVCTLAASVGQSWIVRDLVGMILQTLRGPLPGGFVVDAGFKIMVNQRSCPEQMDGEPLCMRQIDTMEFAFNASAGQFRYLDFIDRVSALLTELLDRNQPAGSGLSLRFTRNSEALIAMQQFSMTCSIEIFSLRGLPGSEEFMRRVQQLAYEHGGNPHWGLIHDIDASQVFRLYGENHTTWRRVLMRLLEEGRGRASTFSSRFSVERGLEPIPGCAVPPSLVELGLRILEALGRRRDR